MPQSLDSAGEARYSLAWPDPWALANSRRHPWKIRGLLREREQCFIDLTELQKDLSDRHDTIEAESANTTVLFLPNSLGFPLLENHCRDAIVRLPAGSIY